MIASVILKLCNLNRTKYLKVRLVASTFFFHLLPLTAEYFALPEVSLNSLSLVVLRES